MRTEFENDVIKFADLEKYPTAFLAEVLHQRLKE